MTEKPYAGRPPADTIALSTKGEDTAHLPYESNRPSVNTLKGIRLATSQPETEVANQLLPQGQGEGETKIIPFQALLDRRNALSKDIDKDGSLQSDVAPFNTYYLSPKAKSDLINTRRNYIPENTDIELFRAVEKLYRARNVFEARAAYEHMIKKALDGESAQMGLRETLDSLHEMVHEIVLSDALADYEAHPELFSECANALHNYLPVVKSNCDGTRLSVEDAKCLKDIWNRFSELYSCKTSDEVHTLMDEIVALFEQHPEFWEAGYRRLRWEIENEIIGTYMEAFYRANRSWRVQCHIILLAAIDNLYLYSYLLDFFQDERIQALTPQDLREDMDLATLRMKLKSQVPGMSQQNIFAISGFSSLMNSLTDAIASAVLDKIRSLPSRVVSKATKLRAQYLNDLLCNGLWGCTGPLLEREVRNLTEDFVFAQLALHKICTVTNTEDLAMYWGMFLVRAGSRPELDALNTQAILSLTLSLLSSVEIDDLPETLQCWIRFISTIAVWPMGVTNIDEI
jgi:hypothetical protein